MNNQIFESIVKSALNEDQQSKSMDQARKLYMEKIGCSYEEADGFIRNDLRGMFPQLRYKKPAKFILAATRLYLENSFTENRNRSMFNSILKIASADDYINNFDRNLNNLSFDELVYQFENILNDEMSLEKAEINNFDLNGNNDYEIVKIDSFKQARQYGSFTSWCVTHDENMYRNYTDGNENVFYFCLKKGYQNLNKNDFKYSDEPLDEYGLSMLAICVDCNGRLKTCTCRWNHDNGGNDNIMNTLEISKLLGVNFYDVFKPRTPEELRSLGIIPFSEIQSLIKSGENLSKYKIVIEQEKNHYGLRYVTYRGKCNYVNENNDIISPKLWFDETYDDFSESMTFTRVVYADKMNLLSYNGELLLNKWIDNIEFIREQGYYSNNFVTISDKMVYNILNISTNSLISDTWYSKIGMNLSEGFIFVSNYFETIRNGGRYSRELENLMGLDGKLLLKEWAVSVKNFRNGFARIKNEDNKVNFVNHDGNVISKKWFCIAEDFTKDGYAIVGDRGMIYGYNDLLFNYLSSEGKILSEKWFTDCGNFKNGFAIVKQGEKQQYVINSNGDILNNEPFFRILESESYNGFDVFKYEDGILRVNILTKEGILLSPLWLDGIEKTNQGYIMVKRNKKENLLKKDGTYLSEKWFDFVNPKFKNGFAIVGENGKYNFIDKDGNILSKIWFDNVSNFINGFAIVGLSYGDSEQAYYNFLNTEGKLITHEKLTFAENFRNGFALVVSENNKANFLGTNGQLLIKTDKFIASDCFSEGFGKVSRKAGSNGDLEYNFIDTSGNLIGDMWYDSASDFYNGFARVKKGFVYNFIDTSGKIIRHQWYSYASYFENGFAIVGSNIKTDFGSIRKFNYIDTNGNLLSDKWFSEAYNFHDGYGEVVLDNSTRFIDKKGKLHKAIKSKLYADKESKLNECISLMRRIEYL